MKKLLFAIIGLAAFAAVSAQAQSYGYQTLSLTGIGTTAGGTTTTVTNQIIDCRGANNVALQAKFNFSDATTSNVVFTVYKSLDKTNWDTTGTTWTVAGNGTTDVIATTSITTSGVGWLKLGSIQNTHASLVLTNKLFQYSIKKNAP